MKDATYLVGGMSCGGCSSSVTNALTRALGDVTVAVTLETGEVRITGDHEAAAVEAAVAKAGFDFGGQK